MNFEDPGCTWGGASPGEAPGHFCSNNQSKALAQKPKQLLQKVFYWFAGDSLMTQLHCDIAMSEKFLSTTFFISRSSMFSGVAATMPNTVAPALAKRAALSEVFEHLAACCSQLTHGRQFCLSVPSYTSMFSR